MPSAIQYGMSLDEFWYGDMRLLDAYKKAYMRDRSYTAWLNGNYAMVAHSISLGNAFAKKGQKQQEYPQWKDPIEKLEKPKVTNSNLEVEFRKRQAQDIEFVHRLLHRS